MKIDLNRRPIDPRISNIALDSNALDHDGTARDQLVGRFKQMCGAHELTVVVAGGVRGEVQHPNTPAGVKAAVLPQIFNLRPGLTKGQQDARRRVAAILQGHAKPGAPAADASPLSEAAETGCTYFITHDKRMIDKREAFVAELPLTLHIVTLDEFFDLLDRYEDGRLV
jgi:hypothetical protein